MERALNKRKPLTVSVRGRDILKPSAQLSLIDITVAIAWPSDNVSRIDP